MCVGPRIGGHFKLNLYLVDRRDIQQQLTRFVQLELVVKYFWNKWWETLKDNIMSFTTGFRQKLSLDKAKMVKIIKDRLSELGL